jgi:hypothetical protein
MIVEKKWDSDFFNFKFGEINFIDCKDKIQIIDGKIEKTIDNRLKVNKISIDGFDDYIKIHPTSGNEVDLS